MKVMIPCISLTMIKQEFELENTRRTYKIFRNIEFFPRTFSHVAIHYRNIIKDIVSGKKSNRNSES